MGIIEACFFVLFIYLAVVRPLIRIIEEVRIIDGKAANDDEVVEIVNT